MSTIDNLPLPPLYPEALVSEVHAWLARDDESPAQENRIEDSFNQLGLGFQEALASELHDWMELNINQLGLGVQQQAPRGGQTFEQSIFEQPLNPDFQASLFGTLASNPVGPSITNLDVNCPSSPDPRPSTVFLSGELSMGSPVYTVPGYPQESVSPFVISMDLNPSPHGSPAPSYGSPAPPRSESPMSDAEAAPTKSARSKAAPTKSARSKAPAPAVRTGGVSKPACKIKVVDRLPVANDSTHSPFAKIPKPHGPGRKREHHIVHFLSHKDPSDSDRAICDICGTSVGRSDLPRHFEKHLDCPVQYMCMNCDEPIADHRNISNHVNKPKCLGSGWRLVEPLNRVLHLKVPVSCIHEGVINGVRAAAVPDSLNGPVLKIPVPYTTERKEETANKKKTANKKTPNKKTEHKETVQVRDDRKVPRYLWKQVLGCVM